MPDDVTILECRDLKKSFGPTPALQGASLNINRGEIIAIMGPSGSGKSTLLHCLAGIFKPDSGEVLFEGHRLDKLSDEQRTKLRRTTFGFVFQFGQLVPELTAEDNIALPLLLNKISRKEAYKRSRQWFKRLGIAGMETHRSGELSGGQSQRVALARSLVIKPKILFADEPTGSLDSYASEKVMELLVGSAKEENCTVVLVTHDSRIAAYADRQVVVRDGKVTSMSKLHGVR